MQSQLKEARARAAVAESELAHLKGENQNNVFHNAANIDNLKHQISELDAALTAANARIHELEAKYEHG